MKGYTKSQIDRIGNAIIFFAKHINCLNKTQLLKLLYLTEEESVRVYHKPLFYTDFEVWQFGPVIRELYINLNNDGNMFSDYIKTKNVDGADVIEANREFSDDEFSDNDIALLKHIVKLYGAHTAKSLVRQTHRKGGLWYKLADQNGLLGKFKARTCTSSDVMIDLSEILDGCDKEFYNECIEAQRFEQQYN